MSRTTCCVIGGGPAGLVLGLLLSRALVDPVLRGRRAGPPGLLVALLRRFPALSVVPARLIGLGFRPETAPAFARPGPR